MKKLKLGKKQLLTSASVVLFVVLVVTVIVLAVLYGKAISRQNTISVGIKIETLILDEGTADDADLCPGDSVEVSFKLEVSDYDGVAEFYAYLSSDADDFYSDYFTVTWTIAGEDRSTVTAADDGEQAVVTVKMNDETAGAGNYYITQPSFRSVTLIACLTE